MATFKIKDQVISAETTQAALRLVYPSALHFTWRRSASDYSYDEYAARFNSGTLLITVFNLYR